MKTKWHSKNAILPLMLSAYYSAACVLGTNFIMEANNLNPDHPAHKGVV